MWVRTRFLAPQWLQGERYELYFEDVTYACRIYFNGRHVADHAAPLYPFSVDVTDTVKPGEENHLELLIFDDRVGRTAEGEPGAGKLIWPLRVTFYSDRGSIGVRGRQVRLRAYPGVYISDMFVMPSVSQARLALRFSVRNTTAEPKTVELKHLVLCGSETVLRFPIEYVGLDIFNSSALESIAIDGDHLSRGIHSSQTFCEWQ